MTKPVQVFVSYAHRDERLRKALDRHLSLLKRAGTISVWHDRVIDAGDDWRHEIDAHLESAQVILALVSPSFIASDYCYETEMRRALERHEAGQARLIPVILRPVDWQNSPLGRLQALPAGAKPVASWKDRDAAFADVAAGIRRELTAIGRHEPPRETETEALLARPAPEFRPPIWNVPHNRNSNFTGRNDALTRLRSSFVSGERHGVVQVLCGLAGVGKTQLALEFVYRNASYYGVVWWLAADEPATLPSEFSRLAEKLGLPAGLATDQIQTVELVREWLDQTADWLLVFDDARDPRSLQSYLPRFPLGHLLITSRNPSWRGLGRTTAVGVLPRDDSVAFLLQRTGRDDAVAASKLAASVGDLPLALEQAAAYVEETGRSLSSYLELFQSHQSELMDRATGKPEYPVSLRAVWDLSFREVEEIAPASGDLLALSAFFAPEDIPLARLGEHSEALPNRLRDVVQHPLRFDEALQALRRYSLVEISGRSASVHALVQAFTRDRLDAPERRRWVEVAALLMYQLFLFERDSIETWRDAAVLLPHVLSVTSHAEALGVASEVTARLRDQAGLDLRRGVELARARELLERAVAADEQTYGANHARVATTIGNLAAALEAAGDLRGAQEQYERALAIDEKAYGPNDLTVASDASKLGAVLRAQGELASARVQYDRALAIDEDAFGANHPLVAGDLAALAQVLKLQGDLTASKAYYLRALAIEQTVYGEHHPKVATRLGDLGSVRWAEGDLAGARELFEKSLAIAERAYRPNHTAIGSRALELAKLLLAQNDYRSACERYAQAAQVFRDALGEHHPQTISIQRTLESLREQLDSSLRDEPPLAPEQSIP